ncbi:uncharacterized protein [Apostichopus japonicus]
MVQEKYPGPVLRLDREFLNYRPVLNVGSSTFFHKIGQPSPRMRRTQSAFRRKPRTADISQPGQDDRLRKSSTLLGTSNSLTVMDGSNSSKISGFPRRVKTAIKRTKSTGKFDKQEKIRVRNETIEGRQKTMSGQLKPARSHESLVLDPGSSQDLINLAGSDFEIRPLHSSILGQDHCFQITTAVGSKYYSCRSDTERDKWIESILSAIYPDKDDRRRLDSSLKVWVVEGKNLPGKKRYFCEICLDDGLFARTTPKLRGDMLFWGEQFQFSCLPDIDAIKVHVYKEIDKKRKRDKNYIGHVNIPIEDVNTKTAVERWFPLEPPLSSSSGRGDPPTLRIKARYQSLSILPLSQYSDLAQYLRCNAVSLCHILEQEINVKAKEEVATCLVKILQCLGTAKDFLINLVLSEMENIKEESLVFRANTMATKSMEAYLKLIGAKYLQDTLGDFIQYLYDKDGDCEVDPTKLASGSLLNHQSDLTMLCEMVCCKILNSPASFPAEIRAVFQEFRKQFGDRTNGNNLCNKLISGCIFLRFLCPAVMSPSLFNLVQEFPSDKTSRCLTLIAKTTQALANFTKFGAKESYMVFMNEFLEREWGNMNAFLKEISTYEDGCHLVKFDGYIDLGRELSLLHTLLSEALSNCEKAPEDKLSGLKDILANISGYLDEPGEFISYHTGQMRVSRSFTSTSTTNVSSNLKKIFEDRANREDRDVEMLPPYNIAMDRTITTSSTVNSLVDFIQKDGEKAVSAHMESDHRMVDSRNICQETDNSKVEVNKTESVNESRKMESTHKEHENGTTRVSVKSETVTNKQSYSVRVETNGRTPLITPVDQLESGRPSSSVPLRTMPLSFSNPAFHFSRPRDVSPADSGSSVNSGADSEGASSNMEGDVSHTSSSEEPSPKSSRRKTQPPAKRPTSHTLPKAASSRPQVNLVFEDQSRNHLSESSTGLNPATGTTNDEEEEDQVSSPTEAIRAANHARKTAFFASMVSPSEETPPQHPTSETSRQNIVSEATLTIQDQEPLNLQPFAITIQNPHAIPGSQHGGSAIKSSLSLPLDKENKLSTISEQTLDGYQPDGRISHVELTAANSVSSSHSAPHLGILSLDSSPTRSKPAPTQPSTSPPKGSPPRTHGQQGGVIPRPKIRTELSSKQPPDVVSSYTRHIVPEGEGYLIHTKKTTQVQSSQTRRYVIQETAGETTDPVWTRRSLTETSEPSPLESKKFEEVRYEMEIETLKLELDRVSSQLAETQLKLEEEGKRAEEAMEEMRLKMKKGEEQMEAHKEEKDEKERQIRDIIDSGTYSVGDSQLIPSGNGRLMSVEDDLKRGQDEMQAIVSAKQKVIDAQERRIESLDAANVQLMGALEQLKERYKVKRRTKSQGDLQVSTAKLSLSGNYKDSKC